MTPRPGGAPASAVLDALVDLPALIRASVFAVASGTVRAAVGAAASAPPPSLLVWARHSREVAQQRHRVLEDVIITTTEAHHLLRELPSAGDDVLWVHVEVDGRRGNLALARRRLAQATRAPAAATTGTATVAPGTLAAALAAAPAPPAPAASPTRSSRVTRATAPRHGAATGTPGTPGAPSRAPVPRPGPGSTPRSATPALAMLPPLPESYRAAGSDAATAAEPDTAGTASVPEVADRIPAPRRVPLMGRPRIAFVDPPTVPPPPLPGAQEVVVEVTTPAGDGIADATVVASAATPAELFAPAATQHGAPATGDDEAAAAAIAPESAPTAASPAVSNASAASTSSTASDLPTRNPGEHRPPLPAPRRSERPSSWGTDGGTLRRLLVGLRRLA